MEHGIMALKDWIRLLMLALVWGSAFFLIEIALRSAGPFTIVLVRVLVAAIALHIYCYFRGVFFWPNIKLACEFAILGLIANAIPFTLISLGQTKIDSGLTAIIIATTPLFTIAVAHLFGRSETVTPAKIAGLTVGIAGIVFLMGPTTLANISGDEWGEATILLAAFFYAISAVYGRRFMELPPAAVAAWMLTAASIILVPTAFSIETPFSPLPSLMPLVAMIALALLSTAFAFILYFKILASAGATNAMLVTFVQPPLAILLGVLFLNETLSMHQLGGLLLILTGLALVDGRLVSLAKRAW
jgi:drug/metabolite transporter (DMT)-like permease